MDTASSLVVLALIALIAREMRVGNRLAKSDPSLVMKPNERFRTLRMQMLEPVLGFVIVGSILFDDLAHTPVHLVAALVGAAAGYAFGVYRARTTYVAAVPAHRGLILRYSIEAFLAVGLLVIVKLVAEQDLLPEGQVFRTIIAGLLGFLVIESAARVLQLVRYYRRDEQDLTTASATES